MSIQCSRSEPGLVSPLSVSPAEAKQSSRAVTIVKYVIKTFILHASIAKPLGESGKLQLTTDMAELEFALNAFMSEKGQSKANTNWERVGDDYRILRAMR